MTRISFLHNLTYYGIWSNVLSALTGGHTPHTPSRRAVITSAMSPNRNVAQLKCRQIVTHEKYNHCVRNKTNYNEYQLFNMNCMKLSLCC